MDKKKIGQAPTTYISARAASVGVSATGTIFNLDIIKYALSIISLS